MGWLMGGMWDGWRRVLEEDLRFGEDGEVEISKAGERRFTWVNRTIPNLFFFKVLFRWDLGQPVLTC